MICGMATLTKRRSLCPVPARGRDASTRNLSYSSRPVPLNTVEPNIVDKMSELVLEVNLLCVPGRRQEKWHLV